MHIKPMLCKDDLDKFIKHCGGTLDAACLSNKLDGVRCLAEVHKDGKVNYWSRNGKLFANFGCFDMELVTLAKWHGGPYPQVFDGEVVGDDYATTMTQVHRKINVDTSKLRFKLFDIAHETTAPFDIRYGVLCDGINTIRPERLSVVMHQPCRGMDKDSILRLVNLIVSEGGEGLVLKRWSSTYQQKKSVDWCKVKLFDTLDLPVIEVIPGNGKHEGRMGALVCDLGNGHKVEVGTGFSDAERELFMQTPPSMIEVKYQERTKKSLRFPAFVRVREDK